MNASIKEFHKLMESAEALIVKAKKYGIAFGMTVNGIPVKGTTIESKNGQIVRRSSGNILADKMVLEKIILEKYKKATKRDVVLDWRTSRNSDLNHFYLRLNGLPVKIQQLYRNMKDR
jgi:hypothetical protein